LTKSVTAAVIPDYTKLMVAESNRTDPTAVKILAELEHGAEISEYERQIVSGIQRNTGWNPYQGGKISQVRVQDTDESYLYPSRNYDRDESSHTSAFQHNFSAVGQDDREKKMSVDDETPSEREIILKEIHDHLNFWFGRQPKSMFKLETSKNNRDIEISFKHNEMFWLVRFPKDFPGEPAELFCSRYQETVHLSKVFRCDIVQPLNNEVNILLSIKNKCNDECNVCNRFTKESLF
jgi:hypothetical protein